MNSAQASIFDDVFSCLKEAKEYGSIVLGVGALLNFAWTMYARTDIEQKEALKAQAAYFEEAKRVQEETKRVQKATQFLKLQDHCALLSDQLKKSDERSQRLFAQKEDLKNKTGDTRARAEKDWNMRWKRYKADRESLEADCAVCREVFAEHINHFNQTS